MTDDHKGISYFKKLDAFIHPAYEQSNEYYRILDDADTLDNWTLEDYKLLTNWNEIRHNGWELPGTREPHYWCGQFALRGCTHTEDHHLHEGKAYAQRFQRSCFRKRCSKCVEKWIARQASTATKRVKFARKKTDATLSHVVLSLPPSDWEISYNEMKAKARQILSMLRMEGYALVFHPYRFLKKTMQWYYSPHFHLVGYGEITMGRIIEAYGRYRWFIKDLGPRESIFNTFGYLLRHAGVKDKTHTLIWGGSLSYSKVKIKHERKSAQCPLCGRKLVELYFTGQASLLPPGIFEDFVDPEGWHVVKTEKDSENKKSGTFEYDPRNNVNEILKGIATAR